MGYNQHHAGLHFCHYPKADCSTYKYDITSRPLAFETKNDLVSFKKQMEKVTGKEYTKAEYLETGDIKKKRKRKTKPEIYLEEFVWYCPEHNKKLKLKQIDTTDEWSPSVGYCKKCKKFYCLPTVGHYGLIITFKGKKFKFGGEKICEANIAGSPVIKII